MRTSIELFKERIPEILFLGNLDLKDRHWNAITNIVGFSIHSNQKLKFKQMLNLDLRNFIPQLEIISDGATNESNLKKKLNGMIREWQDFNFTIVNYKYL